MFVNWHEEFEKPISNSGTRYKSVFSAFYNADGVLELEEIRTKDIYTEIQAYKDSVDINTIMKKYQNGDDSVLNKVQGFFADVTGLPKDMQSMFNSIKQTEEFFEQLPADVKTLYNNDFHQFMFQYEPQDFIHRYNEAYKPKEELKENEQE